MSKRDTLGASTYNRVQSSGRQKLLDLLYSINSSLESAQGPSNNSEGKKKRPQNVLELTVGRHVVSEGRLFYQDKGKIVT